MLNLAEQRGWVGNGTGTDLEKLLKRMIDESDPRLPVGYIKLDEVQIEFLPLIIFHLSRMELFDEFSVCPRWQAEQR